MSSITPTHPGSPSPAAKALTSAALLQAGFPVPPGFVITTAAYRNFVAANELQAVIQHTLAATEFADPASLETASAVIRAAFAASQMPASLQIAICSRLSAVSNQLLAISNQQPKIKIQQFAIRSSATAEEFCPVCPSPANRILILTS